MFEGRGASGRKDCTKHLSEEGSREVRQLANLLAQVDVDEDEPLAGAVKRQPFAHSVLGAISIVTAFVALSFSGQINSLFSPSFPSKATYPIHLPCGRLTASCHPTA